MINPNDVGLIIFDMDGTVVHSLPAVYESISRAFAKLGWPVTFSAGELGRFFGTAVKSTADGLFKFITPPDSHVPVEEVRSRVGAEYAGAFREMARPFQDVKETLATLRGRGYKLAQYTNAPTVYLNIVMESLELRKYYDYIECIQDNDLTKPELVRKIRAYFGGLAAAVVGDRIQDIEAARANDCLSVGVLFGYGDDEPRQADIAISSFHELLTIFDRQPGTN
jgi:phosphoglycolate phosphatase